MNLPEYIQTDERSLVRETRSGALLNTDKPALERNRTLRAKQADQRKTNQEVNALRSLIDTMEERMTLLAEQFQQLSISLLNN